MASNLIFITVLTLIFTFIVNIPTAIFTFFLQTVTAILTILFPPPPPNQNPPLDPAPEKQLVLIGLGSIAINAAFFTVHSPSVTYHTTLISILHLVVNAALFCFLLIGVSINKRGLYCL